MQVLKEVKKSLNDGWVLCFQMVKSYNLGGKNGYRFVWQKDNKEVKDVKFTMNEPQISTYIKELQNMAKSQNWFQLA